MLCPEATDVQVQVLFTRALEREGLLDVILSLIDEHAAGEQEDELEPRPSGPQSRPSVRTEK